MLSVFKPKPMNLRILILGLEQGLNSHNLAPMAFFELNMKPHNFVFVSRTRIPKQTRNLFHRLRCGNTDTQKRQV